MKRMIALFVLFPLMAWAQTPDAPDCSKWSLHGVRIGADLSSVRELGIKSKKVGKAEGIGGFAKVYSTAEGTTSYKLWENGKWTENLGFGAVTLKGSTSEEIVAIADSFCGPGERCDISSEAIVESLKSRWGAPAKARAETGQIVFQNAFKTESFPVFSTSWEDDSCGIVASLTEVPQVIRGTANSPRIRLLISKKGFLSSISKQKTAKAAEAVAP